MKFFLSLFVFTFLSVVQQNEQQPASDSTASDQHQIERLDTRSTLSDSMSVMETAIQSKSATTEINTTEETKDAKPHSNHLARPERTPVSFTGFIIGSLLLSFLASIMGFYFFYRKKAAQFNEEKNQLFYQLVTARENNQSLKLENQELEAQLAKTKALQTKDPANILEQKIVLPGKQKTILKIGDILYVQSQKNAISIVTNNEPIWVWETLMNFKSTLPDSEFCRAHRSYLINLNEVVSYSKKSVILSNNQEVKIGQTYSAELMEKLQSRASNR